MAASVEPSTHGGVRRPLFAQEDDEVFVTGGVICRRRKLTPPRTQPLGHKPVFCCRRTSYDRTRRVFLLKTDTTCTPDPIRPTIGDPDPNRPTNGSKQGGYDLGVFVGGFWSDIAGDSRTEFNRILCTSKSETAVTSRKKLRCRYVEADY